MGPSMRQPTIEHCTRHAIMPICPIPGPTKSRPDAARSRPDAARVGRDSNPCMTVPIPSAAPGLSVVTVGWLLELSFKKPYKMRSLMA